MARDYQAVYDAGYKAGYNAAIEDWEIGYQEGDTEVHQMQEKVQDQGDQTNRRRARPHWQGEDEQGDYDGVDQKKKHRKKKTNKPRGR